MAHSRPPNPVAMDPPHITEFASQRYFEKLRQLSESRDQPQDAPAHPHDGYAVAQSSTFILPIKQSRPPDQQTTHDHQKPEKRRGNFSFRTILPTRTSAEHYTRNASIESTRRNRYWVTPHECTMSLSLNSMRAVSRLINYSQTYPTSSRSKSLPPYRSRTY